MSMGSKPWKQLSKVSRSTHLAIRDIFMGQAEACDSLGSPFTAALCRTLGAHLDETSEVGALCLNWPGKADASGDNLPLRLCGGLQALVLTRADDEFAAAYDPKSGEAPAWKHIADALEINAQFLLEWMKSPPQTNEVQRSSVLMPALMRLANQYELPFRLLEIGASAGLNLQLDRFRYTLGKTSAGDLRSALHLRPDWSGPSPALADIHIASRAGCDINPLDVTKDGELLRLRSYLWPDQSERIARFDAAVMLARANPAQLDIADAVTWLDQNLNSNTPGQCTLVYSTIAWQYLADEDKARGEELICAAGAQATHQAPLVWLQFEADGQSPGAGIKMKQWPGAIETALGRADYHGRWVNWLG